MLDCFWKMMYMTPILQALCLSEVDDPVEATCRAVIPVSGKRGREGGRQTPGRGDPPKCPRRLDAWGLPDKSVSDRAFAPCITPSYAPIFLIALFTT